MEFGVSVQYLDNGNMINDNKGYLQDDLTPTNESTESFEGIKYNQST